MSRTGYLIALALVLGLFLLSVQHNSGVASWSDLCRSVLALLLAMVLTWERK